MKKIGLIILLIIPMTFLSGQTLKPYILALKTSENIDEIKTKVFASLEQSGLKVVGQYQPANDDKRWIIVFGSPELESAVTKVGGLTGFAATLRLGITRTSGTTIISYTNPEYWGNAYFRDDFSKVESSYNALSAKLKKALSIQGSFIGTSFGSEKGIESEDLRDYHYMMGMPYFDDVIELEEFDSHQAAIDKLKLKLSKGIPNVKKVYEVSIPGKEIALYGFALSGEDGESKFLPTIDIGDPKHTAFLPYEVLVMDKTVLMLHGRYRIAISFPDLTMGTFSKIMSTPGDIEELLEQLVK